MHRKTCLDSELSTENLPFPAPSAFASLHETPHVQHLPDWWDYTCLPKDLVEEAARLTPRDIAKLSRPGFRVVMCDTLEDFYLAEALEYIDAWKQSTADNPVGICGPIGPTEQLRSSRGL